MKNGKSMWKWGCDVVGQSLHSEDTNPSKQNPCKHSIDLRNILWRGVCMRERERGASPDSKGPQIERCVGGLIGP